MIRQYTSTEGGGRLVQKWLSQKQLPFGVTLYRLPLGR